MYYTMCKSILRGNIEKHIAYHKSIGWILTFSAIGHTICHIVNTGIIYNITYNTGYMLILLILIMVCGVLLKNRSYSIFKFLHYGYYAWLFICILHRPNLKLWFIIPLTVFTVEHFMNFFLIQYSSINNEVIFENSNFTDKPIIYLPIPRKLNSIPGSYYYIMVPQCGLEWHPFSVANTHCVNQLLFLIEVKGDWTRKLYVLLKNKTKETNINIIVMGPYITPSCEILKTQYKNKLCICSGSGISPFLSIIDSKIDEDKINKEYRQIHENSFFSEFEQNRVLSTEELELTFIKKNYIQKEEINFIEQNLKVIWVFRKLSSMYNFLIYIRKIMKHSHTVKMDIYITGYISSNDKKDSIKSKYSSTNIKIYFGRPNFNEVLHISNSETYDSVNYCGNSGMNKMIKTLCKHKNIS